MVYPTEFNKEFIVNEKKILTVVRAELLSAGNNNAP